MRHILVVDDEPKIARLLEEYLRAAGYRVSLVERGDEVADRVRTDTPDLILLDVMLPGRDGLDVCREIRAFSQVPIIMVTARVEELDRLLGLELGADDYICKPFSPREVVARVKAIFRRLATPVNETFGDSDDGLSMQVERHEAQLDGVPLTLTRVEFRLLDALARPPGRVWSRDQLLDRMYDDGRIVSDRTVDSHVANLRRKLQAARPQCEGIQAVYGVGYRLDLA